MDATIRQAQLPAGWMADRRAAARRTELRAGELAAWPALAAEQPSKTEQLQDAAQKWVGQTFFGTMLKQMRSSPFKSEVFSGGRGGEAFTSLLDQQLAERMARGAGRSLATSIVRQIGQRNKQAASEDGLKPELRTGRSSEDGLKPGLRTGRSSEDGLKPGLRTGRSSVGGLEPEPRTE